MTVKPPSSSIDSDASSSGMDTPSSSNGSNSAAGDNAWDVEELISQLTLDEKVALTRGMPSSCFLDSFPSYKYEISKT